MVFDVERFLALTAGMAVSVACARSSAPASSPESKQEPAVVAVPTPQESEPEGGEELVAVVEDDGRDPRDGEDGEAELLDASDEGAPYEEYGVIGALTGGPMLEGGLGLRGIGSGGGAGFGAGVGGLSAAAKPTPKVRLGAKAIRGKLDPQVIQRVVRSKMSRIRACYEKELLRGDFSTKIVASFVIGSSGRVTSVKLSQASRRSALDSCVQQVFRTMHFPAPKGGGLVTVSYPLVFSPK